MEDLLLCLIANGAGVIDDQVRVFFAMDLLIAFRDERAYDLFGVVEVHLATKGLDVEGLVRCGHGHPYSFKYIVRGRNARGRDSPPAIRSGCRGALGEWRKANGAILPARARCQRRSSPAPSAVRSARRQFPACRPGIW